MRRGEIWWAELASDAGFRPVAVVSRDIDLQRRTGVTIAEVTRTVRGRESEVPLSKRDGMPEARVINADNLHTVPVTSLVERITMLSDERMFALNSALRFSLDLQDA